MPGSKPRCAQVYKPPGALVTWTPEVCHCSRCLPPPGGHVPHPVHIDPIGSAQGGQTQRGPTIA